LFLCNLCVPLRSALSPYTTLLRSCQRRDARWRHAEDRNLQRRPRERGCFGQRQRNRPGTHPAHLLSVLHDEGFPPGWTTARHGRSEEHTSELQSREKLVCRLLLEK